MGVTWERVSYVPGRTPDPELSLMRPLQPNEQIRISLMGAEDRGQVVGKFIRMRDGILLMLAEIEWINIWEIEAHAPERAVDHGPMDPRD